MIELIEKVELLTTSFGTQFSLETKLSLEKSAHSISVFV